MTESCDVENRNDLVIKNELVETNDTTEPIVNNKVAKMNLCRVCEWSKATTYFHGPGVCNTCRRFFVRTYPTRGDVSCIYSGSCVTTGKYISCRKCRLTKCIKIGMKIRHSVKRHCTVYNRWPKIELGTKCICCEMANSTVGYHYGSSMCLKCAKWYSACKCSQEKVKRFKCFSTDRLFENKCYQIPGFEITKCSKCRYEKITKAINVKK